ncbi:sigma-54 interaction domain-containing protein [Desulfovibrio ferrophilus]|uniref:Sigma-54 dependent transcriptional regulator n=1 Tax=Desulfovibrio ferrophilus TaxID=241368 RepID=A0A2Z6AUF5_9BACT|nr:sigma 54-interacting transcriptional regulator [Desulfovibrio ferrophilus]BBD06850.1 sigma-54 dependent transcriptional regulator [Desulfovibrio ferrophilus]
MKQNAVKNYLEGIIETMSEGLLIVGRDGKISMVNEALEKLTGFSRKELLGKPCTALKCDACKLSIKEGRDHWCRLFDTKKESRQHCRIIRKDGTTVEVIKNATLLTENGEALASVETLTDISAITERDRRIEELSRLFGNGFHGMVGNSTSMRRLFSILERAAQSDAPVIIYGESGTGKELAAHAIHTMGPRANQPFVQFNCAALNESLLESELFGHVKGAFTGAIRHRQGRFEAAHQGDIFLDEIGDVPLNTQVKLLRVLESKIIERVGDHRPVEVDTRIITATNRDLNKLVRQGKFREDFFYRINVIPIYIPPLRERTADIPLLARHFMSEISKRSGKTTCSATPGAMRLLARYPWPGNVRELRSALEYACVVTDEGPLIPEHLPPQVQEGANACDPIGIEAPHEREKNSLNNTGETQTSIFDVTKNPKEALIGALKTTGGNQSQAAKLLSVNRGTVANRMKKYGVDLKKVIEG